MSINFNITGEISNKEVGLISIILITTIGAILTVEKSNLISYIFIICVAVCIVLYLNYFIYNTFESDWIINKLPLLLKLEKGTVLDMTQERLVSFSERNPKLMIPLYEQFYFIAIIEKKFELAEAFKDKINDLKNTTVKN